MADDLEPQGTRTIFNTIYNKNNLKLIFYFNHYSIVHAADVTSSVATFFPAASPARVNFLCADIEDVPPPIMVAPMVMCLFPSIDFDVVGREVEVVGLLVSMLLWTVYSEVMIGLDFVHFPICCGPSTGRRNNIIRDTIYTFHYVMNYKLM